MRPMPAYGEAEEFLDVVARFLRVTESGFVKLVAVPFAGQDGDHPLLAGSEDDGVFALGDFLENIESGEPQKFNVMRVREQLAVAEVVDVGHDGDGARGKRRQAEIREAVLDLGLAEADGRRAVPRSAPSAAAGSASAGFAVG